MKQLNILLLFAGVISLSACQMLPVQQSGQQDSQQNASGANQSHTRATRHNHARNPQLSGSVNDTMQDKDRRFALNTLESIGNSESFAWVNDQTGFRYVMTPTKTVRQADSDRVCRLFETRIYKGGLVDKTLNKACRDKKGNWRIRSARLSVK